LIRDEQAKNPNKLMVWTKKQRCSAKKGGIREEKQSAADGHLRWTGDRRSAMVKHIAIAHDYCISAGIRCQQKKAASSEGEEAILDALRRVSRGGNLY